MIKYLSLVLVLFLGVFSAENSLALEKKVKPAKATIKTSAVCGMCKKKIEGGVKKLEGVQQATLAIGNQQLKVKYEPNKVTLEQIKKTISALGYDADEVKADPAAYSRLPGCCKADSKDKEHHKK